MTERFSNQAVNVLSAEISTTTTTSCTVIDATRFPTSGNFRIKIEDEILIVTAVAGTTFTVTRGAERTTAATHPSGATVRHLLTKGGLEARVANRFLSDVYANKPAAGVKGRLFFPTDGIFVEYDDGAAWHQYGPFKRFKAPPQTGWTWVNQGNATVTYNGGALVLEDPDLDATAIQLRCYVRPLSPGTTTLTAAFAYNGVVGATTPKAGFCMRSVGGTDDGNITTWGYRMVSGTMYPYLEFVNYNSPTGTVETTPQFDGRQFWPQLRVMWLKWVWAGGNKQFWFSTDGINFIKWYDVSFYDGSNPMQFGVFVDPMNNPQKISMSLLHWEEG